MRNYILFAVMALSLSTIGVFALKGAGTMQEESRGEIVHTPVDCAKQRPQVRVKSSADSNFYDIDVCAVADSSYGEDFRHEINK
jgi:hypothetical protein